LAELTVGKVERVIFPSHALVFGKELAMSALKVSAIIASSVICLTVGVGIGAVGATYLRLTTDSLRFWREAEAADADKKDPGADNAKGMGTKMPKGGTGGMFKPPSAKAQLNTLIAKLDVLTQKPLTVSFDDEQKKKVKEHLQGLAALEELTEDDAAKRLDGLLEVLKDQKEPLAVAGFRWPGEKGGGFGPPIDLPNPFKEEAGAKHLDSLEKRLAKTGS
jgi:hypothetical protein